MGKNKKKARIFILLSVVVVALIAVKILKKDRSSDTEVPEHIVKKGPLVIAVTSGGSLQSRDKETIVSELEGKNTVIWVIDEGVPIQKGDLLLEFDASDLIDKRNEQEIIVANAESNLEITSEKLGITKGDCEGSLLEREVEHQLAKMALEKYIKGDYPQQTRQQEAEIALADEEVKRAVERYEWSQKLADAGFLTRTELQADELALQRKNLDLEMSKISMNVLTNFTVFHQKSTLEGNLRKAERAVLRTTWQNKATLRQVESELRARLRERDRATNRLADLTFQIEKSKIYAPTNGIVLYASTVLISRRQWWRQPLAVGSSAVEREELIHIPLESGMIVEVMIPEASLNKIDSGMVAKVKVDAFPGREFKGKLVKIGILPDGQSAQLNPDLKLYKCEIECDFQDATIRPGMSCEVELIKESYKDVISVPVQCVVRVCGEPRVYARDGSSWTPRRVRIGLDNNRMVHVLEGLKAGETIMLAPPVTESDQEEKPAVQPEIGKQGGSPEPPKTEASSAPPSAPSGDAPARGSRGNNNGRRGGKRTHP